MGQKNGFTLIELSIVLVIIGLIVGGVLLGRDLIKAAEIRAQVSQIEKYRTIVNAFRVKYGYLPGDLPAVYAARLGFFAIALPTGGTFLNQDGNGFIGNYPERQIFWRHLTDAQMVDGNFGTAAAGNVLVAANGYATLPLTPGAIRQIFPPAKIGRGNYIFADSYNGRNYYHIGGITCMEEPGNFDCGDEVVSALTPVETQQLDNKFDDGLPLTGKARAMSAPDFPAAIGGPCVNASGQYDLGATNGNVPNCQMEVGMQ